MSRWPLLIAIPILAILAGTYAYYLNSAQTQPKGSQDPEVDIGVEDFDTEDGSDVDVAVPLNNHDLTAPDEAARSSGVSQSATGSSSASDPSQSLNTVETIDDEDTLGETVDEPTVIEDDEEGGIVEPSAPLSIP